MEQRIRLYECMYIVDPTLDPSEVEAAVRGMHDLVVEFGGTVKNDYDWGRRRLAYKIRQWTEGLYRILYFEGTGEVADQLKRHTLMDTRLVRAMVVTANPLAIYRPREEVEQEAAAAEGTAGADEQAEGSAADRPAEE